MFSGSKPIKTAVFFYQIDKNINIEDAIIFWNELSNNSKRKYNNMAARDYERYNKKKIVVGYI